MDTAYVYGTDRLSLDRFDGSTGYYLYDPKGSVTGITNGEGQICLSYRYSAFGEITYGAPQYENIYAYNGESYNPNVGSLYLRARYYNVMTGAFFTEDSYLGNLREPLTLNRYVYCVGNPVNYVDPSGKSVENDIMKAVMSDSSIPAGEKGSAIDVRIRYYHALVTLSSNNATADFVLSYNYDGGRDYFNEILDKADEYRWNIRMGMALAEELRYIDNCEALDEKIEIIETQITEIDVIVENGQVPMDVMFERSLPEVLARMIYQEMRSYENGEQSKVLWVVVNRLFTEENFTKRHEQNLRNVLYYGGFTSLMNNNDKKYNAYRPEYESGGWKNAKLLAASLYALVENQTKEELDEEYVRKTLASLQDTAENFITNEIGVADSFYGSGGENHFYRYSEGK